MGRRKPPSLPSEAVIYARVSSKEQEEGFSIPAQLKLLTDYAADKKYKVKRKYIDVESAKRSGRKNFTEMLNFLEKESKRPEQNSRCRVLLVEKTDRLYRTPHDWIKLDDIDLEIHFVKEGVILSKNSCSSDKFMHGIKVLMAKNYIDNLSEETQKGMRTKAESGIYPSQAPLGYINVQCGNKRIIQPDPDIAPLITQLYKWYATGNYSYLQLSNKASEMGLSYRKSGKKIHKSVIEKILKNPIYYGDFRWNGKIYHGTHDPLISKDLYETVQNVILERSNKRSRQQKHSWAFQGMLTCGHCGCALTAEKQKEKYIYYHCTGNKGKCPEKKYVREEEVDRQFKESLSLIRMDERVISWVVKALKESHSDEKKFHDNAISTLQAQYRRYQNMIEDMYEDKLDRRIKQDFYDRKSSEWEKEQDEILRKIERHQTANRSYLNDGIRLLELAQRAVMLYEKQEMSEKRKLLNFVHSNSTWKDGKLHPVFRKPFDMIAEMNTAYNQKKAVSLSENDLSIVWLPNLSTKFYGGLRCIVLPV